MRRSSAQPAFKLPDILGWCGVVAILIAYAGSLFGYFSLHSPLYLFLNIGGSIGILFEAWHKKDLPASALNIIWALIALVQLFRL